MQAAAKKEVQPTVDVKAKERPNEVGTKRDEEIGRKRRSKDLCSFGWSYDKLATTTLVAFWTSATI